MEKKLLIGLSGLVMLALAGMFLVRLPAQAETKSSDNANLVSTSIVISQVQAGGGIATDEFIELHNVSSNPVDLNGHRLVYRSAGGSTDINLAAWTTSTVVPPGAYFLVASSDYDGGVAANTTYTPSTCSCSISGTGGGLAIRNGALNTGTIIDMVGWGTATNAFIETAVTTAPPINDSRTRLQTGCQDTDNNSADFTAQSPAAARSLASPAFSCTGGGSTNIFASLSANPTTVVPGGNILFTVSVVPATTPPSTGITVTGNLSNIGGGATQQFFDNGTNGDVTAGDNVFSFATTLPLTITGGQYGVSAVATDAEARSANTNINITVNAPAAEDDPLVLGNPTNATTDILNENNYLMVKPQYSLSYNRANGTPNWVAWRLDSSWIGSAARQDNYRADTSLPSGWYQVQDNDYSGSGYDRGHMCPSGDRTRSVADNSATFLMTNFVPQYGPNNQGPWNDFENYCRSLANSGQEVYIITGPVGNIGTIAAGRVVIPQYTWKVVLILPNGTNDLSRVTRATRAFGIIVPNFAPVVSSTPWENYRVTVDAVEAKTGYNFFSAVPKNTQEIIERRPYTP